MHRQICHVSFKNHRELIHWSEMVSATIQLPTAKFYIHKRFITKCNLSKVQFSDLFWDFFYFTECDDTVGCQMLPFHYITEKPQEETVLQNF